jgi:hypothetical protein
MTTSGASTFNLDLNQIIEEAYSRCGSEVRSGWDFKTARISLNLMLAEWANKGINLWTVEQGEIPMVQGQITYPLPVDTVDLLDMVIRTQTGIQQTDININRISSSTYSTIPNKNAQGRPIQVWINRQSGAQYPINGNEPNTTNLITGVNPPNINVWPCPDQNNYYTFVYWRLRRMQDAGNGVNTQDIPFRLLPALVAGLTYYIGMKIPEAFPRLAELKIMYDEAWQTAADEDREKASLRLTPRQYFR